MRVAQRSVKLRLNRRDAARGHDSIHRHRIGKRKFGDHVNYFQKNAASYSVTKKSRSSKTVKRNISETWKAANCARLDDASRKGIRMNITVSFLIAACAASTALRAETTVFTNGNIYTGNERAPHAEALAAKDGRITFVGSNADAKKFQSADARIIDLTGKTVVPGLTDSHCHIFGIGEREMNLNLEGANTLEDFLAKVKERAAKTERGKWITGRGWIETFWQPPQFPTRDDLANIAPDNPVFLTRADGHAAIANSAALKTAGIDQNTANPFGGEILKDKSTGEPTGMLLDHAQGLVTKNIPKPTEAEHEKAFLTGVKREIGLGWCEIQNAGSELPDVARMRHAFDAGQVKLRVYNAVYAPGPAATALLHDGMTVK